MIGQKYRIIKQNNPPMKVEFTGTLYDIKSEEVPYSTNLLSGGRFVTKYLFKNITNVYSTSSSGEKINLRAKAQMFVTSDDTFQYYRINGVRQEIENPEEYYNIQSSSTTSAKEIENPEEYYNTMSKSSEPSKTTNPVSWSSRMRRFQPTTWSAGMRSRKLRKSKKKRKTRNTRRKKKFRRRKR